MVKTSLLRRPDPGARWLGSGRRAALRGENAKGTRAPQESGDSSDIMMQRTNAAPARAPKATRLVLRSAKAQEVDARMPAAPEGCVVPVGT